MPLRPVAAALVVQFFVSPLAEAGCTFQGDKVAFIQCISAAIDDLEQTVALQQATIAILEDELADQRALVDAHEAYLASLEPVLTVSGTDAVFEGVDLHVRSGSGSSYVNNGRGNLILGYNEEPYGGAALRTGSHNLVVGPEHDYTGRFSLVSGLAHTSNGSYQAVVGGLLNQVNGTYAASVGGSDHVVDGLRAVALGGTANTVDGEGAVAFGGSDNQASGAHSVVTGWLNTASSTSSSVLGGYGNLTYGSVDTVLGGSGNTSLHSASVVLGGVYNVTTGDYDIAP